MLHILTRIFSERDGAAIDVTRSDESADETGMFSSRETRRCVEDSSILKLFKLG